MTTDQLLATFGGPLVTAGIIGIVAYVLKIYRADPNALKEEIQEMRKENRVEFHAIRSQITELDRRVAHIEGKLEVKA